MPAGPGGDSSPNFPPRLPPARRRLPVSRPSPPSRRPSCPTASQATRSPRLSTSRRQPSGPGARKRAAARHAQSRSLRNHPQDRDSGRNRARVQLSAAASAVRGARRGSGALAHDSSAWTTHPLAAGIPGRPRLSARHGASAARRRPPRLLDRSHAHVPGTRRHSCARQRRSSTRRSGTTDIRRSSCSRARSQVPVISDQFKRQSGDLERKPFELVTDN